MDKARGLPIAAYLGALVALALAAAFVAMLAIVIWLPPRPPDVMRADVVADHFREGYDYMLAEGRPWSQGGMVWRVGRVAPVMIRQSPPMERIRAHLADDLSLAREQVRVSASGIVRSETFVFRVRDIEDVHVGIAKAARESQAESPRQARGANVESDRLVVRLPDEGPGSAPMRTFEFHLPDHAAPAPPAPPTPSSTWEAATAPTPPAAPMPPIFAPAPEGVSLISGFEIGAQLPDGRWLSMRQGRNWAELGWIARAASIIAAALAVLTLLAMVFARRIARPIQSFANAVQAVGVDPRSEPVLEQGPRELQGAARAVNSMQARLRALIADRTKTLAAVAHDMRTPLMRLRLAAENAPSDQRDRMAKEIGEVEALVASFIAFARDDPAEEVRVRLDLSALLQSIADDHLEAGYPVSFNGEERVVVTGQSLGLKRLFNNLVENALKYGTRAHISMKREGAQIRIDVVDDGPGIPAEQRESAFEPFVRLGNGEGKSPNGAGLGLAIARSIARAHGGDVALVDAERGALMRVTLTG